MWWPNLSILAPNDHRQLCVRPINVWQHLYVRGTHIWRAKLRAITFGPFTSKPIGAQSMWQTTISNTFSSKMSASTAIISRLNVLQMCKCNIIGSPFESDFFIRVFISGYWLGVFGGSWSTPFPFLLRSVAIANWVQSGQPSSEGGNGKIDDNNSCDSRRKIQFSATVRIGRACVFKLNDIMIWCKIDEIKCKKCRRMANTKK